MNNGYMPDSNYDISSPYNPIYHNQHYPSQQMYADYAPPPMPVNSRTEGSLNHSIPSPADYYPDEFDEVMLRIKRNRKLQFEKKKKHFRATPLGKAMERIEDAEISSNTLLLLSLIMVVPLLGGIIGFVIIHNMLISVLMFLVLLPITALFIAFHSSDAREAIAVILTACQSCCLPSAILLLTTAGTLGGFLVGYLC
ncbi:MAG: hypothetical protein J2P37_14235 [Ktedonobacteraceae bacterium]|nr:hypothetical protein [Ktedonobacteraceae bacterium]MBO0790038.1 hypothetical protein [Ktedonobacteraceae bacterium]